MVAIGLNPRDQLLIDHPRGTIVELTHALVEQADQILDSIGHRRVGGEAGAAMITFLIV